LIKLSFKNQNNNLYYYYKSAKAYRDRYQKNMKLFQKGKLIPKKKKKR